MSDPYLRIRQLEGEAMDKDARVQRLEGLVRWAEHNLRITENLPNNLRRTHQELLADMNALGIAPGENK